MLGRLVRSLGFWIGITVFGVVLLGICLSAAHWGWLQGGTSNTSNAAVVRNVALVVGGLVAILVALWRSLVAEHHATAAKRQSETGERAYLNERYRQAASMLGDSELPVRLGGIFALERLAKDHPAEFPQEAVKLLLEFVRTPPTLREPQPNVWDGWLQIERPATRQDVQVAVDTIGELVRLDRSQDNEEKWWRRLDLHDAQLCGVDLSEVWLVRANLRNANLMFACLERMPLQNAQLQRANCRQARLGHADLSGAEMNDADFSEVRACGTKFVGAEMPKSMVNADLEEADLTDAVFPNTDLTGAKLRDAIVTGAKFRGWGYSITHAGVHEAEDGELRITQEQLDEAAADPDRPPTLSPHPVGDTEPRKRLVWRGKAPTSGDARDE